MDHSFGGSVHDHLALLLWMGDETKPPSSREKLISWFGSHCIHAGLAL